MGLVLGVHTGIATLGWALVERVTCRVVRLGLITTDPDDRPVHLGHTGRAMAITLRLRSAPGP